MYLLSGSLIFFPIEYPIKSYAALNFSGNSGSFCKTPPLLLKFGMYLTYMIKIANVKKITLCSVKISLYEELKAIGPVE